MICSCLNYGEVEGVTSHVCVKDTGLHVGPNDLMIFGAIHSNIFRVHIRYPDGNNHGSGTVVLGCRCCTYYILLCGFFRCPVTPIYVFSTGKNMLLPVCFGQQFPRDARSLAVSPHLVVGWLPPLLLVKFPHIVVQIPMVWWSNPPIEVLKIRILAPKIFAQLAD